MSLEPCEYIDIDEYVKRRRNHRACVSASGRDRTETRCSCGVNHLVVCVVLTGQALTQHWIREKTKKKATKIL